MFQKRMALPLVLVNGEARRIFMRDLFGNENADLPQTLRKIPPRPEHPQEHHPQVGRSPVVPPVKSTEIVIERGVGKVRKLDRGVMDAVVTLPVVRKKTVIFLQHRIVVRTGKRSRHRYLGELRIQFERKLNGFFNCFGRIPEKTQHNAIENIKTMLFCDMNAPAQFVLRRILPDSIQDFLITGFNPEEDHPAAGLFQPHSFIIRKKLRPALR